MQETEKERLSETTKVKEAEHQESEDHQSSFKIEKTVPKANEQSITSRWTEKILLLENLEAQIRQADAITQNLLKKTETIKSVKSAWTEKPRYVDELGEQIKEADIMTQNLITKSKELLQKFSKTENE